MSSPTLHAQLESHGSHATLYLTGMIDAGATDRVVELCDRLPQGVRGLRIDWRPADASAAEAAEQLASFVRAWRERGRAPAVAGPVSISVRMQR
ncbi:MAG: hypothetical protein ACYC3Q_10720 [Gemmatimonadaceae bacterium]